MLVTIIENGPAVIKPAEGDWVVVEGAEFTHVGGVDKPVAICRCGQSATKILCDGNHKNKKQE